MKQPIKEEDEEEFDGEMYMMPGLGSQESKTMKQKDSFQLSPPSVHLLQRASTNTKVCYEEESKHQHAFGEEDELADLEMFMPTFS